MMPSSKIVLPSSDAEEYNGIMLRSTISRIVNPTRKLLIPFSYATDLKKISQVQKVYTAEKSTRVRIVQVGGQMMCCFLLRSV